MDGFLLSLASFVILLVPMILLHELGHFISAKLVGITVLEFGLGFPPRAVVLFRFRGTEYTLNWLPLGGFVRPLGEDFVRPVADDEATGDWAEARRRGIEKPKSVNQAGPWERMFFMSAGAGMNFITALILFVIMALIGLPVVNGVTMMVQDVTLDSAAAQAGLAIGDVITQVDGERIDSTTAFTEYLTFRDGNEVTLTVEREDGESFETSIFAEASQSSAVDTVIVMSVSEGSPAFEAGILPEDVILSGNGEPLTDVEQVQGFTSVHKGEEVALLILRDGEEFTVNVVPRENPPAGQGAMGIGIANQQINAAFGAALTDFDYIVSYEPTSLPDAIRYSYDRLTETVGLIIQAPVEIIRGNITPQEARPVSIVGLSQIGGQRLEESVEYGNALPILDFAAVISLALGLTNLLPIPGLDGGRIVFVVIELLRGKPISPEREGMVHMIGLLLLLGFMSIFILNDIINPITLSLP